MTSVLSQKARTDRMVRVNHAREFGATQIYAGQIAVMGARAPGAGQIAAMAEQEARHCERFDAMIAERGVRPTLLQPLWKTAGFALGAVTALAGPEAAMACTAAVETEIDRHYRQQLDELGDSDPELSEVVDKFRDEELEHLDTAIEAGAERAPAYPLLSGAIRLGCRLAIRLSERI
jgi:3-demethoxyubiquinol 3-hydroxylase